MADLFYQTLNVKTVEEEPVYTVCSVTYYLNIIMEDVKTEIFCRQAH